MDVCRRGYRGVFWSNLVSGKCARGRGEVLRNYLLDKLGREKSSSVGCQ